jgi:hypothetical protein
MRNTADVTCGEPIALLQSISCVSAINPLVAFYDIHGRERCYSFILSRPPHETSSSWDSVIMYYFHVTDGAGQRKVSKIAKENWNIHKVEISSVIACNLRSFEIDISHQPRFSSRSGCLLSVADRVQLRSLSPLYGCVNFLWKIIYAFRRDLASSIK